MKIPGVCDSCSFNDYVYEAVLDAYNEGRKNAIDEFLDKALKEVIYPCLDFDITSVTVDDLKNIAIQMKEKK